MIRLPGTFLGFVEGCDSGWIDLHVTMTEDGKDLRVTTSFKGRKFSGGESTTRGDTRAGVHIALAGRGFIVRSVKVRPVGTKRK